MNCSIKKAKKYVYKTFRKDFSTLKHSLDVYCLTKNLYLELPDSIKGRVNMTNLFTAALLHDIGKITISKKILQKPCELTEVEKEIIKLHAVNGKKIVENIGYDNIADFVFYHHEREDGKGYFGLSKVETPFESKIIAVTDTFSALTLTRAYRRRMSTKKAIMILKDISGVQLDETIVSVFCKMLEAQIIIKPRFELYILLIQFQLKNLFHFKEKDDGIR